MKINKNIRFAWLLVCVNSCNSENGVHFAATFWSKYLKLSFMMWNKWPQIVATEEAVLKVYLDLVHFMVISEHQLTFNYKNCNDSVV